MKMYILKKVAMLIPILLAVSILVFLMQAAIPGDPVEAMFAGQVPDEETVENLRAQLGLDQPLHVQYIRYISNVVQGDLGTSIRTGRPVIEEISERYSNTLILAVASLLIAIFIGVGLGIISAMKKDSIIDTLSTIVALLGVSMPSFWLGLLLMYLFAVNLKLLPVMGSESWAHLVLPALTMGLISAGIIMRMVRSSLLEVFQQDYIRTARSKGMKERKVVIKHALKNALIPVITVVGLQFGFLLGGAFIIENVFAWHGLGQLAVQALGTRDFPLVQGIILVVAATYVLVNLLIDILYSLVDARVSYE
ncbi:ABC transporter permease [Bacillus carboniphilus]|uniref:Nickel import system permease protein NikB n=1 Tax=Bacillus carboniphilus TaxID=86663 RepID=A0ABN0VUG8_9BACI